MLAENSAWVGGALRQRSRNSSYCRRSIRWICAYKCSSLGDPAHSWMVPTKSQRQGGLGQFLQGYRLKRQQEDLSRLKMAVKNRKEKKKSKTHQQWNSREGVKQLDEEFRDLNKTGGLREENGGDFCEETHRYLASKEVRIGRRESLQSESKMLKRLPRIRVGVN